MLTIKTDYIMGIVKPSLPRLTKAISPLQYRSIFKKAVDDKNVNYQLENILWFNTKFLEPKLYEMYHRWCGELTVRSWVSMSYKSTVMSI